MTEPLHFHFSLSCIGEGNGNALQCSRLENPRDGGIWWAAVYGVTLSQTRLKRLSSSSSILLATETQAAGSRAQGPWKSSTVLSCRSPRCFHPGQSLGPLPLGISQEEMCLQPREPRVLILPSPGPACRPFPDSC